MLNSAVIAGLTMKGVAAERSGVSNYTLVEQARVRKVKADRAHRAGLGTFPNSCQIIWPESPANHGFIFDRGLKSELCAGVKPGEIVIFDKACIDFEHLADLAAREVFWVTRAKDNQQFRVVRKLQPAPDGNILADEVIELSGAPSSRAYPNILRRVVARVEVEGDLREIVFLTNSFAWSAQSVADLYRCRRSIECFFKDLKQTLQLADLPPAGGSQVDRLS